jgi:5-methylcytosine-specific restriction endonuclease McrA
MKFELLLFSITAFILVNMYYDGHYGKILLSYKKYYSMGIIAFFAVCFYLLVKRNPAQTRELLYYTNNAIKYMPIDKSSMDMITPIFDLSTKTSGFLNPMPQMQEYRALPTSIPFQGNKKKRAVSETKKKYIASMQNWKCAQCGQTLTHTYEIDHKIRLENGGGNDVGNLVALCRECHGQKTAFENM